MGTLFIFKEGREGRLLSFCLEPINMNSVLLIFSIILGKPAIYVVQVLIQGRLNGVDITIWISQMGIISIHSWHRVRQTIGQIIDILAKTVKALILLTGEYHTWGCNILYGNHWQRISGYDYLNRRRTIFLFMGNTY